MTDANLSLTFQKKTVPAQFSKTLISLSSQSSVPHFNSKL